MKPSVNTNRGPPEVVHFTVRRSSPSIPGHPANELESQTSNTKGYISARSPAELVLELVGRYDVSQLQVLSHESKIASRIEVSVLMGSGGSFKNLGYLEFDDNNRSGFVARELQCVQLGCEGVTQVRLVLQKPHLNELNKDGHVGIIGLNLLGWRHVASQPTVTTTTTMASPSRQSGSSTSAMLVGTEPEQPLTKVAATTTSTLSGNSHQSEQTYSSTFGERHSDAVTVLIRRAEELKGAKDSAVSREAYDEALKLKNAEQEARRLAEVATELEKAKMQAVAREDYEEAKRIKAQLDDILHVKSQSTTSAGKVLLPPISPGASVDQLRSVGTSEFTSSSSTSPNKRPSSPPVPAHAAAMSASKQPLSRTAASPQGRSIVVAGGLRLSELKGEDEEGPPAGYWDGIENEEVLPIAEPLDAHLKSALETKMLIQAIGLYAVRCLYSADIRLRGAVLEKLDLQLRAGAMSSSDQTDAILTAAAMGLGESAPHMIFASTKLLDDVLDRLPLDRIRSAPQIENTVMPQLLEAMANSSTHVQQTATSSFLRLAKIFGVNFTIRQVVSKSPSTKRSTLWRPLHSRLVILQQLLTQFQKEFEPITWTMELLEWMKSTGSFVHANENVRDAALELTLNLYKRYGDKMEIEDYLRDNLRSSTLEKYMGAFAHLGSGSQQHVSPSRQTPAATAKGRSSIRSTMSPTTAKPSAGGRQIKQENREEVEDIEKALASYGSGGREEEDDTMCHFCQFTDVAFRESEDAMDLHMWRDCPMLGHCPHCNQVIEISQLNEHLLEECDFRNNHRACPRCGEAIAAQLFEKHVRRNACLVAKPRTEANRCPLCHQDIAPFESGWRHHLMEEGCPNNVRTMDFQEDEDDEGGDFAGHEGRRVGSTEL